MHASFMSREVMSLVINNDTYVAGCSEGIGIKLGEGKGAKLDEGIGYKLGEGKESNLGEGKGAKLGEGNLFAGHTLT